MVPTLDFGVENKTLFIANKPKVYRLMDFIQTCMFV